MFLPNPAAPTGNVHPRGELTAVLERGGEDWLVVLDEAYGEFAGTDMRPGAALPAGDQRAHLQQGVGLAGARIGYALMGPELAEEVRKALLPFSLSCLQAAVALARWRTRLHGGARRAARAERERLRGALAALPQVEVFPSRRISCSSVWRGRRPPTTRCSRRGWSSGARTTCPA